MSMASLTQRGSWNKTQIKSNTQPTRFCQPTIQIRSRNSVKVSAILGNLFQKKQTTPTVVADILRAVENSDRGLKTTPSELAEIKAAYEELEAATSGNKYPDPSATWRLLWTTEKETLFIIKNANWFGTKAGEVYQVIDTANNELQNVIEFPPEGAFIVDSGISYDPGQPRVNFKFTAANVKLPNKKITLPPVGKGWFENIYIDSKYRFARDIRGDYLICIKDGPPRKFE